MKAVVAAFNQEKALVGAFSVITNLRMDHFEALRHTQPGTNLAVAMISFWIASMSLVAGKQSFIACGLKLYWFMKLNIKN